MRTVGVEIVGTIGRRPGRRTWDITGVSTDSRAIRPGELFFALTGARVDGHDFVLDVLRKGAAAAVVSREIAVPPEFQDRLIRVGDTLRALGDSAQAFRRRWNGMVIAVTGSNGKTTTREMIYHVLSGSIRCKRSPKSFNTDVGVPLTIFQAEPEDRILIVEMGTNAPGEIARLAEIAEPNAGIVTSIAEAHLEGLRTIEGVAHAKGELIESLGKRGTAFLNADDDWFRFLSCLHDGPVVSFGITGRAAFRAEDVHAEGSSYGFSLRGVPVRLGVPGRHNVLNALAALAVADHLGLDLRAAAARLAEFRLPQMRCQIELVRGVTVVFDGYNANPGSMRSALATFGEMAAQGRKVAVLGDMLELGPDSERFHDAIGREAAQSGVEALWAIGHFSAALADAAQLAGVRGPVCHADEFDSVSEEICDYLKPGDALLVKGSRGMKLERLVEKLKGVAPEVAIHV